MRFSKVWPLWTGKRPPTSSTSSVAAGSTRTDALPSSAASVLPPLRATVVGVAGIGPNFAERAAEFGTPAVQFAGEVQSPFRAPPVYSEGGGVGKTGVSAFAESSAALATSARMTVRRKSLVTDFIRVPES